MIFFFNRMVKVFDLSVNERRETSPVGIDFPLLPRRALRWARIDQIAMPGQDLALMLPDPQRDWLRNQLFQRNAGMRAQQIDGNFVAFIESLGGDQPLWQEDVWPEWRVQLEQPAMLREMLRDARLGA